MLLTSAFCFLVAELVFCMFFFLSSYSFSIYSIHKALGNIIAKAGSSYQRAMLTLMSSAAQLYAMMEYVRTHKGQHWGPHTAETLGAPRSLCCRLSCFINSTINAEVSSRRRLYDDAGWHIYSICTVLMAPCGFDHLIDVFHLVRWSFVGPVSVLYSWFGAVLNTVVFL